jgi:hypothetical protein
MTKIKQWRKGIVQSDLQPLTRLVLLTISNHLDATSVNCTLRSQTIVMETSMSRTSVVKHLNLAEAMGWLVKSQHSTCSRDGYEFNARLPTNDDVVKIAEPVKPIRVAEPVLAEEPIPQPPEGAVVSKREKNGWKWGTSADLKVAEYIYGCIKRIDSRARQPNYAVWSNDVRLMRSNDERTPREICEVFKWANEDKFWQSNILSPSKLRDKYTALKTKMGSELPTGNRLRKTKGNPSGVVL